MGCLQADAASLAVHAALTFLIIIKDICWPHLPFRWPLLPLSTDTWKSCINLTCPMGGYLNWRGDLIYRWDLNSSLVSLFPFFRGEEQLLHSADLLPWRRTTITFRRSKMSLILARADYW